MAHPYASQAKASQKRRLGALNAKAGKAWGSSSMYKSSSLPKKNAGSSTPMTISGGTSKKRPDRYASGGSVGHKRRPHTTTNIIISHAGGRGGSGGGGGGGARPPASGVAPVPVPVNRPVPVPVPAGGAPGPGPGLPGAAPVARPPVAPMGAAAPVARPPLPAGPPPVPVRPPGMKAGGVVKKKIGGEVPAGKGYKGYPHSPTSKVEDATSALKKGGAVKRAEGGDVEEGDTSSGFKQGGKVSKRADGGITVTKKLQIGGGANFGGGAGLGGAGQGNVGSPGGSGLLGLFPGRQPVPPQQGATNLSGRQAIPFQQPVTVPMGRMASSALTRPAPGTTTTFAKKGGSIPHSDEAQDKKLIKKMIAKEDKAEKRASGGFVPTNQNSKDKGLAGTIYRTQGPKGGKSGGMSPDSNSQAYYNQGKGFKDGGSTGGISNASGGAAGGLGRLAKTRAAK